MNEQKTLSLTLTTPEILDALMGIDSTALNGILKLLGGRNKVIDFLVEYFKDHPNDLKNNQKNEVFQYILFECSGNNTYREDWEELWPKLEDLPLSFLVDALQSYKPGKNGANAEDVAIDWLLSWKYNTGEMTQEIYGELVPYFDNDSLPDALDNFQKIIHFKNELELFEDLNFIENNYTDFDFDKSEITEILKGIVLARKLDDPIKLELFLNLVDWYAPNKSPIGPRYRTEFILDIFQVDDNSGIEMFSEDSMERIKENFYDIDFDFDSVEMVKEFNQNMIKDECNHITKMQAINPNYRHD